jgi:predicted metal-dependent peptidase
MLMRHDSFFSRMEIHIIQCDAAVQSHAVIHSIEDWKRYAKDLAIRGRGGTNFTPVFDLVEKLRQGGALKRLKGLMYFTDGDGVYPRKPTPYETAFVFTTRKALDYSLPEWIVPLCLEPLRAGEDPLSVK